MTDTVITLLTMFWCLLIVANVYMTFCSNRRDEWSFAFAPVYTVTSFLLAVGAIIENEYPSAVTYSFWTVASAWLWWHNDRNKRRRKKLIDRAAGRVADMGGRLKVVRPNEG